MLKVAKLSKIFISGDSKVVAVKDVSLEILEGTFSAVIGKSGSGKSTLLSLLGALDRPNFGSILIGEREVTKLNDRNLIKYRRDTIGFIFQSYNLVPNLSALENVMLPMEFAGMKYGERKERAEKLLRDVGLSPDKMLRWPTKLSGGEQQRVAIARSLANKPKIILADEPTGNLDSVTGKVIIDLLKKLAVSEKTIIIAVTHDQGIADQADLVFRMKDGRLVGER
jgi:putative ABC transport system ATP-binding protein